MKFGVVIFPGSNCDHDVIYVLSTLMEQDVVELWHKDTNLKGVDVIILTGSFSNESGHDSGSIPEFSPIMDKVVEFANGGGIVLGICKGFQALCEAGLLPGVLLPNDNQQFICKNIYIKSENRRTFVSSEIGDEVALRIPIAHSVGRYHADSDVLINMRRNGQILFRYCDSHGKVSREFNPNGSIDCIAGVCNENKNVFGMMPHPERAADDELGNTDGKFIFESLMKSKVH